MFTVFIVGGFIRLLCFEIILIFIIFFVVEIFINVIIVVVVLAYDKSFIGVSVRV